MNNLDNFYNKKLQNREFEFKNSYWEDAERLIVEDEKKRRFGRYFWLFALLFLCIAGGAAFWVLNPNAEANSETAAISEIVPETQKNSSKSANQSIQKQNDQPSKSENNLSELSVIGSNLNDQKTTISNPSNFKNELKNQNEFQTSESKIANNSNSKNTQKTIIPKKSSQILATEKTTENEPNATNQLKNELAENSSNEVFSEAIESVSILFPIATLQNEIDAPEYPKLKKVSLPKTRKFKLGIMAASLFYPATNDEKSWIGASAGLAAQFKMLKKISLNSELVYTFRTGTFGTASKSNQTYFGFGKQTVEYSSNPENIHFLELPVYVQYDLGRHAIEGGMSFSYLLGVHGNIEKQSSLQPWERSGGNDVSSENYFSGWLSKEGFNTFNTSFLLGYKYALNKKVALGFRSAYRFGDLVKVQENDEKVLLESGPLSFNVSASWFFLK